MLAFFMIVVSTRKACGKTQVFSSQKTVGPAIRIVSNSISIRRCFKMASVNKDSKGWRIRFFDSEGVRKTIRIPGLTKIKAETIGRHIDELVVAKTTGQAMGRQTALWLSSIGLSIHDKLSRVGLVDARASAMLKDFMAEYPSDARTFEGRPAAANTLKKWKQAQAVLNKFFGNRSLRDISPDDAVKFRRWLDTTTLGENGKRTHISVAKMFFNVAKRRKLVEENPFEFQKASLVLNRSKDFFLTRANAMKIIDACPDNQWRLIVALWRFAGLRKMEIYQLRWEHILWDQGRMLLSIPKTKHHVGKESRFIPIGDILPWLEEEFRHAPEGAQRLITRYAVTNGNLSKPFVKIITAAGLTIWPKLIQNLRASCETDWLDARNPAHVVARWIGHSVKVQNDNYAQVDDHHFAQFNSSASAVQALEAVARKRELPELKDEEPSKISAVAQPVAQQTTEQGGKVRNRKRRNPEKPALLPTNSSGFLSVQKYQVPEAGVEPALDVTLTGF